ncbi:scm-like with four MBT domains protein 2 [Zootoca vivipara]|uniref:scm-like with four MBT domains protein 2 n=1 Tax=Zootoca vivipara TaxID=8524 RepID=UPI00293BA8C8|nr:scm-like with four MBT domains protein 2 [Zootoca vivipara]XP_034983279.2 scm-like with four MBT domains protein 2 [Zootoca vivipara]
METRGPVIFSMTETQHLSLDENTNLANGDAEQFDSDESSNSEDVDFNWDEYLEETGSCAAPHTSFKHVEVSLQSSFQPGMKLEVANKHNPETYWVATIITTCGQLLLLRYCGYEDDRRADFWCDVMTADLHPVGWCTQNNKVLMPPNAIKEKYSDWTAFLIRDLTGSRTAPANLLEGPLRGKNPVDLITVDSLIELQDSQSPFQYWIVSVLENIGGRLRLRYVGLEETESYDQWLFYLDYRLRPVGWCQENKYRLEPPAEICSLKTVSEWHSALDKSLIEAAQFPLPMEVFKDHDDLRNHLFTVGMKLEAVDTKEPCRICPATISKVFNNHFVQVTIDDLRPEASAASMICHADSLAIMPVQWCLKNGVHLSPPKGYSSQDFDWADYQKQCGTEAAPQFCFRNVSFSRGFTKNMKLEAVNPKNQAEICVASVISVKGRLMWLRLEGLQVPAAEYIVDVESMNIFPVGWCEANAYKLSTPHKAVLQRKRKIAVVQPEKQLPHGEPVEKKIHEPCMLPQTDAIGTINGRYSCPALFINHRCFSGPHLNKGRLAELPQSVGPGKCVLVLKEVLSMVINSAYKPGSVLRELQLVEDPRWNFQEETLKAKYRGKTYRATVKIVRTSDQVLDFCRRVCAKLECCPNLFSPIPVTEACPENCSAHTKTKYTYYCGKRRKVIKAPAGENNSRSSESRHGKPARRRKMQKPIPAQKKSRPSITDLAESPEESDEEEPEAVDDETWSEESSPELQDDQTDVSSAELPAAKPASTMRLRSSADLDRVARSGRGRRARKTLAVLCAKGQKRPRFRQVMKPELEEKLVLESNPLEWTVTDVVKFIKLTDCAPLAKIFQEQDIDGQALLLLTLPTVQECMELKLGPAIKLCHQIERVKLAFYAQYAN